MEISLLFFMRIDIPYTVHVVCFEIRTCLIYNLCGSIQIYKNQITSIDPVAMPINKDFCKSM